MSGLADDWDDALAAYQAHLTECRRLLEEGRAAAVRAYAPPQPAEPLPERLVPLARRLLAESRDLEERLAAQLAQAARQSLLARRMRLTEARAPVFTDRRT